MRLKALVVLCFIAAVIGGLICISTSQQTKHRNLSMELSQANSKPSSKINLSSPSTVAQPVVTTTTTILSAPSTSVPAPVATPTITTTTTTTTVPLVSTTGGWTYEAATKVAVCEEGGWIGAASAAYPDSLGINAQNWYANGGGACVTPVCQIAVAEKLQSYPPDQNGCAPW